MYTCMRSIDENMLYDTERDLQTHFTSYTSSIARDTFD